MLVILLSQIPSYLNSTNHITQSTYVQVQFKSKLRLNIKVELNQLNTRFSLFTSPIASAVSHLLSLIIKLAFKSLAPAPRPPS